MPLRVTVFPYAVQGQIRSAYHPPFLVFRPSSVSEIQVIGLLAESRGMRVYVMILFSSKRGFDSIKHSNELETLPRRL